ncbi:MAG TPA: DUF4145 domain-containing protein [Casimicrobiaceae bacterium]
MESLAQQGLAVARRGRKHKKNLAGDNFYGNKLAELRADATNTFRDLSAQTVGDTTALAELVEAVFSPTVAPDARLAALRELIYALRTTWKTTGTGGAPVNDQSLFPMALLSQTRRSYLTTVGHQMNGCYSAGWYDACAVMMRRLVEAAIIEAYEHKAIADKIKGADGNYLQLTELVAKALAEPALTLSRNAKTSLPKLRDIGHLSAHGRYYLARKEDIEKVQQGCRIVVEEFLHHAALL